MKPSANQRWFLQHALSCDGWLFEDEMPSCVTMRVVLQCERMGWIRLERDEGGYPFAGNITFLGIAALRWGRAAMVKKRAA